MSRELTLTLMIIGIVTVLPYVHYMRHLNTIISDEERIRVMSEATGVAIEPGDGLYELTLKKAILEAR